LCRRTRSGSVSRAGIPIVDALLASDDQVVFGNTLAFIKGGEKAVKAAQSIVANPLKSVLVASSRDLRNRDTSPDREER